MTTEEGGLRGRRRRSACPTARGIAGLAHLFQSFGDAFLRAAIGGMVVTAAGERRRQAFHTGDGILELMGMLVARAGCGLFEITHMASA
jgi:hypothetical protein